MALCTLFHDLLWDNSKSKMYQTPVHVPTSVIRKRPSTEPSAGRHLKDRSYDGHIQVQRRSGLPWPCHQYPSFFLDDTASTKHSLASQRHSSLCPIQQNIAELPRRAEAEAMCDQKKIPLLIDLVRPSS